MGVEDSVNSTNEQPYAEFSEAVGPPTIFIYKWTFPMREFILGVSLAVACILILILIPIAAQSGGGGCDDPVISSESCLSPPCLETAAYYVSNMNLSADPCEDFYNYACGNYPLVHPLHQNQDERTVRGEINLMNRQKLKDLLTDQRVTNFSTAAKMRTFYGSCTDSYARRLVGGKSFIDQVVEKAGGWWFLDTLNTEAYDLQSSLKKTHVDYWSDVLFNFRVATDWFDTSKRVIEVDLGGLGLPWPEYIYTDTIAVAAQEAYQNLMKTLARLLAKDFGLTVDGQDLDQRIQQFVHDVMDIEIELANITYYSLPTSNPHDDEERVSLGQLNSEAGNGVIDFEDFFKYAFFAAGLNSQSKIVLLEKDYLYRVTDMLKKLKEADESVFIRKINNYFTWHLIMFYAPGLDERYVHAITVFEHALFGWAEIDDLDENCLSFMEIHFNYALSSMFIMDHFSDQNRPQVHSMVELIKAEFYQHLGHVQWMDDVTRETARSKLLAIIDKIAYPEQYADMDWVDTIYMHFAVDRSNFLTNLLDVAAYEHSQMNIELIKGEDRAEWTTPTYAVHLELKQEWNELIIPAGFMQFPIFWISSPKYANFGALGHFMFQQLVHAVDEMGSFYQPDGSFQDWWSSETYTNFAKERVCVEEYYSNMTAGPYTYPGSGGPVTVPIYGSAYARFGIADIASAEHTYETMHKWESDNHEKSLPGLGLNSDQLYFLSYAQTYCANREDMRAYNLATQGWVPENIVVNAALAQTKYFADAFQCAADSKMVSPNKCHIF